MTADVFKQGGYVLISTGGDSASVPDAKGYVVESAGAATPKAAGYAALHNSGAASATGNYAVLANPATVMASMSYAVLANSSDASVMAAPSYAVIHSFYPPFEDLTLDYSFSEHRFPECVSFGSRGGPGFKTSMFAFDSGVVATNPEWERLRAKYDVTFENVTPEDVEEVEEFFYGMRGKAIGFRYKDWSDYVIANQVIAVGDGDANSFQIFKRYESGGHVFDRIIKKTVAGTSKIRIDGVLLVEGSEYFMLDALGTIVFQNPVPQGSVVVAEYLEFDVPVRFDTDYLPVSYDEFHQLNMSLPLIEVLV